MSKSPYKEVGLRAHHVLDTQSSKKKKEIQLQLPFAREVYRIRSRKRKWK